MNALDFAYGAAAAALAPLWMRKQRGGWRERLGHIEPLPPKAGKRVLLHGVSVGEVNALRDLVPMLKSLSGTPEVLVTASTDTGLKRATELFAGERALAQVRRYPMDFSRSVARFLDAAQPDAVVLCELELWPNFIAACHARGIPVGVINGRLSERSFKGYRRGRFALRKSFSRLAFAAVQDEAYAERFAYMGVPRERVHVTGSMKWDTAKIIDTVPGADELAAAMGIDRSKPLIVAGSTAEGEEALLHEACPPGVQLLCAPRKPERFNEAAAALPACVRRSATIGKDGDTPPAHRDRRTLGTGKHRFLLDTIGELRAAYALADIAIIGRSFFRLYGSDPIEPVALGRPTLIGPHYGDFSTIVAALKGAGGLSVVTPGELRVALQQLLDQPGVRARMGINGRSCILANQGATKRHAEMIGEMLDSASRSV